MLIVYIAPTVTDHGSQCRIYMADADMVPRSIRDHYRNMPQAWKEVGLMDHKGSIRCFEQGTTALRLIHADLQNQVPLMAGTSFTYDDDGEYQQ